MTEPQPDPDRSEDPRAVGSVLGALIMVAVTVLVAATLGAFVLTPGGSGPSNAPDATFEYTFADGGNGYGDSGDRIRITYVDGRPLDATSLRVVVDGERVDGVPGNWTREIGTGESITITDDETDTSHATVSAIQSGDGIIIVWEGPTEDVIISSVEVP